MTAIAYSALWLFCFAIPWENVLVIPGFGTMSKLMGMLALGLAGLAALLNARIRRWDTFHILAFAFVILGAWGGFRGIYEVDALSKATTYLQLFMVLWMVWELAPTPHRQLGLLFAYVCGSYIGAISTISVYKAAGKAGRFAAHGFDPNDLGMTLALAIPMAWYLGMTYHQPLLKWVSRAYIPLGLWAIGLTGSRGAAVATIVALMVVPFTMGKLSPGRLVAGVLILVASGAIAVANIPTESWERIGTTKQEVQEGDLNNRLVVWKAGALAFTRQPLVGYGTAGFPSAIRQVAGIHRGAHNTFLTILVEQGLIGFGIFISMLFVVFRRARSLPPLVSRYAVIQLGVLLVAMLPLTWDERKPAWLILAIIVGMAASVAAQRMAAPAPAPAPHWRPLPSRRPVTS